MQSGSHQTGNMGHIHHQVSPAGVGDFPELREIDGPGISGSAGHNQLGLHFHGLLHELVVFQKALIVDAVGHEIIVTAGQVHRGAVGQVAAVGQVHAQNRVAGL